MGVRVFVWHKPQKLQEVGFGFVSVFVKAREKRFWSRISQHRNSWNPKIENQQNKASLAALATHITYVSLRKKERKRERDAEITVSASNTLLGWSNPTEPKASQFFLFCSSTIPFFWSISFPRWYLFDRKLRPCMFSLSLKKKKFWAHFTNLGFGFCFCFNFMYCVFQICDIYWICLFHGYEWLIKPRTYIIYNKSRELKIKIITVETEIS